ncbi:TetR family transcriptional regulator, partial [Rhodococcus erythropolis]
VLAVSALEGSLVRARVERSGQPILDSLGEVADVFAGAIAAAAVH